MGIVSDDTNQELRAIRYMADNPFRVLGIGSATLQNELRRRADSAAQAAKVGLAPPPALHAMFGDEDVTRCADVVRRISTNPKLRTIYRLFWPFEYWDGCLASDAESNREWLVSSVQEFHRTQRLFLASWYQFEISLDLLSLEQAFESFVELYEDSLCDSYLSALLEDEEQNDMDALGVVYEAQDEVTKHLLSTATRRVVGLWESGSIVKAVELLESIIESRFDDDEIDKALLHEVQPAGNREMEKLQACLGRDSSSIAGSDYADRAKNLKSIAHILQDRLSTSADWISVAEEYEYFAQPEGSAFEVSITEDRVIVPPMCACCLAITQDTHRVEKQWTDEYLIYRRTHTVSLDIPLCQECRKHVDELQNKQFAVVTCTVIVSAVIMWIVYSTLPGISLIPFAVVSLFIAGGLILGLSRLLRLRLVDDTHASRYTPVRIMEAGNGMVRFRFMNPIYARHFANANKSEVIAVPRKEAVRACSILRSASAFPVIAWSLVLVFLGSMIMHALAREADNAQPESPSVEVPAPAPEADETDGLSLFFDQNEQRKHRLLTERADLVKRANSISSQLSVEKSRLDIEENRLQAEKEQIELDRLIIDDTSSESVAHFKEKVDKFNNDLREFKADVASYKAHVRELNQAANRIDEIERALDEMGVYYGESEP
ncbi:MAG: hypothetical protein HYX78_08110 [Armatimonadetes bacterium]|nr:hypothetical protein [Armatimonadota bacterium]